MLGGVLHLNTGHGVTSRELNVAMKQYLLFVNSITAYNNFSFYSTFFSQPDISTYVQSDVCGNKENLCANPPFF
jgi:hypothetical protein